MLTDLRHAARSLASRPLVTAVAAVSLALGIGVNAAIFSVFDRLLLRPLPVPAAGDLALIASPGPRPGSSSTGDAGRSEAIFSYPLFRDLERLDAGVSAVAAHRDFSANTGYRGDISEAEGVLVSGRYFDALGLTPSLGRLLGPEDDRVHGGHPVVVLSHDHWEARFGSDPDVIDDTLVVNGMPMTIVGVGPPGFVGNTTLDRPDVFVPLSMAAQAFRWPDWNGFTARNNHWLYLFARLAPGVSRENAERQLNVPFTALIREVELPALRSGMGDAAREAFAARRIVLQDGSTWRLTGQEEIETLLLLLFAVTGLVLAIACANVASLLMTRVVDRSAELAVRVSLGSSRGRVVRLLLAEAGALGLLGAAGALAVARLTIAVLVAILPAEDGAMLGFTVNVPVMVFTLAVGVGTSVFFGLFPALHGARHVPAAGLREHGSRTSGSRTAARFRTSMATVQVALATALLAVAGLFVASLVNVGRTELGIRREGLVAFRLSPYLNGYTPERARALFDQVEDALRALPNVESVASTTVPLLSNNNWTNNVTVEGVDAGADADTSASFARIGTGYFRTLGIPILGGRDFTEGDVRGAGLVAIVNEAFVRKFDLGARAIGARMALGAGGDRPLDIEIVGLARDARYSRVRDVAPPQFYLPHGSADFGTLTFYVRSREGEAAIAAAIPALVRRLDPGLPVGNLRTMDQQIWENTARERVLFTLSSWFAALATALSAIGLYAVLACGVAQRRREIGIRIALGARGADVRRLVFSQVARITAAGGVAGVGLALALGRLSESMLFGVTGANAAIVGSAVVVIVLAAAAASAVPARRAARVNAAAVLR